MTMLVKLELQPALRDEEGEFQLLSRRYQKSFLFLLHKLIGQNYNIIFHQKMILLNRPQQNIFGLSQNKPSNLEGSQK